MIRGGSGYIHQYDVCATDRGTYSRGVQAPTSGFGVPRVYLYESRMMSKKLISRLWILTGLIALVLLVTTVSLTLRATSQTDQTVTAYLTGGGRLFQLYEEPNRLARVRSVLDYGAAVEVVDSAQERDQLWYYVQAEDKSGWIPAESVRLEPPE